MAIDVTLTHTLREGGEVTSKSTTYSASLLVELDESIPDATTDQEILATIDVTAVKAFFLTSDQAITIETNSATVPDDTIVLVANKPYVWFTGAYDAFLLGTDVTTLYVTNASGAAAALQMWALVDATP